MTEILNKPKCRNCGERDAVLMFADMWVCGECYIKAREKMIKQQQEFLITE